MPARARACAFGCLGVSASVPSAVWVGWGAALRPRGGQVVRGQASMLLCWTGLLMLPAAPRVCALSLELSHAHTARTAQLSCRGPSAHRSGRPARRPSGMGLCEGTTANNMDCVTLEM